MANGPIPRGVRRCQRVTDSGEKCGTSFTAGPTEQVVALCDSCAARLCPRGTYSEQVAQYKHLLSLYGWKEA
jgi:hypothetical protein